ncbi:MAG: sensor histidine kinase [Pacificimonas sp.]
MMKPLSRRFLMTLSLALLPIGLIAVLLSIFSFQNTREEGVARIEARGQALAREVDDIVSDHGLILRALSVQGSVDVEGGGRVCEGELTRFTDFDPLFGSLFRVDAQGDIICSSRQGPRLSANDARRVLTVESGSKGIGGGIFFDEMRQNIVFAIRARPQDPTSDSVVAIMPVEAFRMELADVVRPVQSNLTVQVVDPGNVIATPPRPRWTSRGNYELVTPTRLSGLWVRYDEPLAAFGAAELAAIVAPPLMWLAALLIGWFTLRRLVVSPLAFMENGLRRRRDGDVGIRMVPRAGDTAELASLALAFDELADAQKADRMKREEALAAQERLIREVHHRVKNNLQIIASLISIKARDTSDEGQQRAYGVIQMRVTALAHVHRWLYADDLSRGVDLSALMADVTSGLESSIQAVDGIDVTLAADLDGIFVGQDAAVPLSFLVTEIIAASGARLNPGDALIGRVSLKADGEDRSKGCLIIESAAFSREDLFARGQTSASARIVQGMTRQLRGELTFDAERRSYTLNFPLDPSPA